MTATKLGWVAEGHYTGAGRHFRYRVTDPNGVILRYFGDYGYREWVYAWGSEKRIRRHMTKTIEKEIAKHRAQNIKIRVEV